MIEQFVGLRSKTYSIKTQDGEKNKCGGTTVFKSMDDFNFQLYKSIVDNEKLAHYAKQNRFFASKHDMFYRSITKKSMDGFDPKRYLLPCGIKTLAHGSKFIRDYQ